MTQYRALKKYIKDLEVGLTKRLDNFADRLKDIENGLATVQSLLNERPPLDLDPEFVAECLGLTLAESRVAVALSEGQTVSDVAEAAGRAKSTVRWHLRQIKLKLGISTQHQLVRLVLQLPNGKAARSWSDETLAGRMEMASWHSAVGDTYHTEPSCIHGQRVRPEYHRDGMGGRRHCASCEGLARRRKAREEREQRRD